LLGRAVPGTVIVAVILVGLFSSSTKLSMIDGTSGSNRAFASLVSDYQNVTTHEGDLIIDGTQVFVIENCTFIQTGNIYVRDSAKLVLEDAELCINRTYLWQYGFTIGDYGTLELAHVVLTSDYALVLDFVQYSKAYFNNVTSNMGFTAGFRFRDSSKATVHELTYRDSNFLCFDYSNVSITDSEIDCIQIVGETCDVKVSDSIVYSIIVYYENPDIIINVDGLKPGFYEYLDLKEKIAIERNGVTMPFRLTLNKTYCFSWGIRVRYDSQTIISDSIVDQLQIAIDGLVVEISDLKPGFYEYKRIGQITLNKTQISSLIVQLRDESSDVTITNSTLSNIFLNTPLNSNLRLINTVVDGFHIDHFVGNLCFANATWTEGGDGWMFDSVLYMSGNVSGLSGLGRIFWHLSNVTRNYGVIVKDRYDEPTISDASLILKSKDVVVWNGTTDNQGVADFNLTFADGNYTDTLKLEAVKGNWSSSQNVTFLSGTPIVFSSPFPPPPVASFGYTPEKPGTNEQIVFNASESYSPRGNITVYEWNFDDGNMTTVTTPIITHKYSQRGDYTVVLNITDSLGLWNTFSRHLIVYEHDVSAITNAAPLKTVAGQGFPVHMNVTPLNRGDFTEIFNVTVYANNTKVETQPVTLENGTSTTMTFTWNTTGLAYGNYTISVCAEPVLGETYVADNNVTWTVHVGVPGDISGPTQGVYDGKCDMRDVSYLIIRFNTKPDSANWNANADINNDATVNMRDISIAILNFNKHE